MDRALLRDMPELYISRHGQTDWNAEGRLQGQVEVPLNDTGRAQARRNGRHLLELLGARAKDFAFLASPLGRASETMRIIRSELSARSRSMLRQVVERGTASFGEVAGYEVGGKTGTTSDYDAGRAIGAKLARRKKA